jgi:hypothetical protein
VIYGHSLLSWLLVIGVFVGLPLVSIRAVRDHLGPLILRVGSWASARLSPEAELDEEADYLSKVLRRQQLCSEIQRLQRILATDVSMSATRQIANRIAYAQLVRELQDVPDFYGTMPGHAVTRVAPVKPSSENGASGTAAHCRDPGDRVAAPTKLTSSPGGATSVRGESPVARNPRRSFEVSASRTWRSPYGSARAPRVSGSAALSWATARSRA